MERNNLICYLVGYLQAEDPKISDFDMIILIDVLLIKAGFTPFETEPTDESLMRELSAELMMFNVGMGVNRKERRARNMVFN